MISLRGAGTSDRLGPEDARILKLEGGAVCGHTCKVLVLEPSDGRPLPTLASLRESIESRLDAAPRLRQRLVKTPLRVARPVWLDDPRFDIARHVTPVAMAGPVGRSELELIVGELMSRRLDRSHPLWHMDVIEALDDGSMALVWRIHHCLADGATCMRIGAGVLWSADRRPTVSQGAASAPWTPREPPGLLQLLAAGIVARATPRSRDRSSLPKRAAEPWSWRIVARELARGASVTRLREPIGRGRNVAFVEVPLEETKRAAKAIDPGVTLNDLVLAIVAGGVRRWLAHVNGPMDGIRVKVPVNLHHGDDQLGNHDSYFFVDLPVAEPDPARRVLAITRETSERKLDHDAETLYRLGLHPIVAHWAMSPHVFTFNVSNVRGPSDQIYVLGARIAGMYSLAEIARRHALRVSVISAAGFLCLGLCADADAVTDLLHRWQRSVPSMHNVTKPLGAAGRCTISMSQLLIVTRSEPAPRFVTLFTLTSGHAPALAAVPCRPAAITRSTHQLGSPAEHVPGTQPEPVEPSQPPLTPAPAEVQTPA